MKKLIYLLMALLLPSLVVAQEAANGAAVAGGIVAFILIFYGVIFFIAILAMIFWIFMLIDCAKRRFRNENDKIIWIIIIAILGAIGALVYYFAIRMPQGKAR